VRDFKPPSVLSTTHTFSHWQLQMSHTDLIVGLSAVPKTARTSLTGNHYFHFDNVFVLPALQ
jgi:hypothetical protein